MLRTRQPHHTEDGFQNLFESTDDEAPVDEMASEPDGRQGGRLPRQVKPDGEFLRRNRNPDEPTLTWLGHSTFLLQVAGINVLTDPHLGERASALPFVGPKRLVPPAMFPYQLPRVDAVVLSHDHHDHLDRRTLKRLIRQSGGPPHLYVPLGIKAQLGDDAYALCTELDWWQWAQLSGVVMHCVPAHHESGRLPWSHNGTLWCGWIVEYAGLRFYFAGDTGYSPALLEIGRRFPALDLAALPISGHASRWRQHGMSLSPAQAVRLHIELGVRRTVGMHWGTFGLGREPAHVAPREMAAAAAAAGLGPDACFVMAIGQTLSLRTLRGRASADDSLSSRPGSPAKAPQPAWNMS